MREAGEGCVGFGEVEGEPGAEVSDGRGKLRGSWMGEMVWEGVWEGDGFVGRCVGGWEAADFGHVCCSVPCCEAREDRRVLG